MKCTGSNFNFIPLQSWEASAFCQRVLTAVFVLDFTRCGTVEILRCSTYTLVFFFRDKGAHLRVYPTFIPIVLKTDFDPLGLSLEYFECFAKEHYINHFTSVCRFCSHWGRREESKCIMGCAHNSKIGQGAQVVSNPHNIYTQKSPDNARLPGLPRFIVFLTVAQ